MVDRNLFVVNFFLCFDADNAGRQVGRAVLTDDPLALARVSQALDRGLEILKSWAQAVGGECIEVGGDEGTLSVPATALADLESVRHNYRSATGFTISVGVGRKLSEASKALMAAKLRGKDRVVVFDHRVAHEVAQASQKPQDEAGKLREEYLEPQADPNLVRQGPDDQTPTNLGYLAKPEGLNKGVAEIKPGPMVDSGKTINGNFHKETFDYSHHLPENSRNQGFKLTVTHNKGLGKLADASNITSELKDGGGNTVGSVVAGVFPYGNDHALEPHSNLDDKYHGRGLGSAMYESLYAHAKNVAGIETVWGGNHSEKAHQLHQRLAAKHGFEYNARKGGGSADPNDKYPYGSYRYTLKNDLTAMPIEDHEIIGPGKGVTFSQGSGGEIQQPLPPQNVPMEQTAQVHPLEAQFRAMADAQMRADSSVQQQNDTRIAQLKQQIATMLGSFQQQMPIFGQLKSSFPDTYQTIMGMVQSVIALGREVNGSKSAAAPSDEGMMKSEDFDDLDGDEFDKAVLDPSAGYTFRHEQGDRLAHGHDFQVTAHDPSGTKVGSARFRYDGKTSRAGSFHSVGTEVQPAHRRKGLASAMYAHAEKVTGKKVTPSNDRTTDGKALWAGNKANKQFGKEEPKPHHPEGLPAGTLHGGEIKVRHSDGGTSWKQVHEGLSQAQDRDAPLLGANSHPTSPKSPDSN